MGEAVRSDRERPSLQRGIRRHLGDLLHRRMLFRPHRVEDERQGTGHEHIIGEVEDRAVESDGINVKVHEVADMAEDQSIVAIAQRRP